MARNPKSPKEYINQDPIKRNKEKLDKIILWLAQFHYSTRKIMAKMLGLNINSHHAYFKKLEDRKILKRTEAYSIRSDIYVLTSIGKELAAEKINPLFIDYPIESIKINHSNLRHNLAVQKIVIKLINEHKYDLFFSEKNIHAVTNYSFEKKPDALLILEKDSKKTMLEVELTAKSDRRIFKAFQDHCKGLVNQSYETVIYVFQTQTLKNYYEIRFKQEIWPEYKQNENGVWIKHAKNLEITPSKNIKEKFEFKVEENMLKDF
jgi:hypothetical protein